MKRKVKLVLIIAALFAIGFSMASCSRCPDVSSGRHDWQRGGGGEYCGNCGIERR